MHVRSSIFLFGLGLLALRAEEPREYQVTGPVVALTAAVITVERGGEKWEIGRTAATKVLGKLAVGQRVTVYYRMGAISVDVKDSSDPTDKAEQAAERAQQAAERAAKRSKL